MESVGHSNKLQKDKVSIIKKLNRAAYEKSTSGSERRGPGSMIDPLNKKASQRRSIQGGSEAGKRKDEEVEREKKKSKTTHALGRKSMKVGPVVVECNTVVCSVFSLKMHQRQ